MVLALVGRRRRRGPEGRYEMSNGASLSFETRISGAIFGSSAQSYAV